MDIFKNWELCKEKKPKMKEVFEEIERQAVAELYKNKDSVRYEGQMIGELLDGENLDEVKQQIMIRIGAQCVYKAELDTVKSRSILNINVANAHMFKAVTLIFMIALVSDNSYPAKMDLNIIFEHKIFIKIMKDLIKSTVPYLTSNIDKIKMMSKRIEMQKSSDIRSRSFILERINKCKIKLTKINKCDIME